MQAGAMQFERGSHALVALPNEGQLWALGGGQPQRQLDSVEVHSLDYSYSLLCRRYLY